MNFEPSIMTRLYIIQVSTHSQEKEEQKNYSYLFGLPNTQSQETCIDMHFVELM